MTDTATLWHVYLVRCADNSLYTGIARDVDVRVAKHNAGTGARYTRSRLPVVLAYREVVGDHGDALRREHAIKQMTAAAKRDLCAGFKIKGITQK